MFARSQSSCSPKFCWLIDTFNAVLLTPAVEKCYTRNVYYAWLYREGHPLSVSFIELSEKMMHVPWLILTNWHPGQHSTALEN